MWRGRGAPGEESHSPVKVPANVMGSKMPADGADKVPAKEACRRTV